MSDYVFDVAVVGGGIIGLASGWQLATAGASVVVVDPDPGHGSTWAAAGMLAAVTEAHYGEEAQLRLNLSGLAQWPDFAEQLASDTGVDLSYRRVGTLVVAADEDDRAAVRELFEFQHRLGLEVSWHTPSEVREVVPLLAPGVRGGLMALDDHQVDPRAVVRALLSACRSRGVEVLRDSVVSMEGGPIGGTALGGESPEIGVRVGNLRPADSSRAGSPASEPIGGTFPEHGRSPGDGMTGAPKATGGRRSGYRLVLESAAAVSCGSVVLAAGSWSGQVVGVPGGAAGSVRPVKGELIRLKGSPATLPAHTVRGIVKGRSVYMVPRLDGTLVVGATMEERGFETSVKAGSLYEALREARVLLPLVSELHFAEAIAGLRPGTPDNGPIIGAVPGAEDFVVATGHFRNGILLAPITAASVAAMITGDGSVPPEVASFSPARFMSEAA